MTASATNSKRQTASEIVRELHERNAPLRAQVLANIERLREIAAAKRAAQTKRRH
jgi:hypothetical protein